MGFDISEYPEKSGILIGTPNHMAASGMLDATGIVGWEDYTVKYYALTSSTGVFTGNIFDYRQDRDFVHTTGVPGKLIQGFEGRGINRFYVSPTGYKYGNTSYAFTGTLYGTSGIIITYPPSVARKSKWGYAGNHPEYASYDGSKGTGVFNFAGFLSNFSNAVVSKLVAGAVGIDDFNIFGDYIHYLSFNSKSTEKDAREVRIRFVSDMVPEEDVHDPYSSKAFLRERETHFRSDPDYSTE